MIKEVEAKMAVMDQELAALGDAADAASQIRRSQLLRDKEELLQVCRDCTPEDRVYLARHTGRPGTADFIQALFTDFFECKGDRLCREDPSILGGVALYHGLPVTVLGHRKGKNLEENMACNFGMPSPEGYRKAQRLMKQAEKFGRPIITFVDTPAWKPRPTARERPSPPAWP